MSRYALAIHSFAVGQYDAFRGVYDAPHLGLCADAYTAGQKAALKGRWYKGSTRRYPIGSFSHFVSNRKAK